MVDTEKQAIAEVYAQAIFDLASQANQTGILRSELDNIAGLLVSEPGFKVLLESPSVARKDRTRSINNIFQGRVSELTFSLLNILARKGRLNILTEVQQVYAELLDMSIGKLKGSLTTAIELDDNQKKNINLRVNKIINKEVQLAFHVVPTIIGGMILEVQGTVMDSSISRILKKATYNVTRTSDKQDTQRAIIAQ
ncbi:MAG: ATP synthase F1 subunit delta [Phycisphaerae bacterium]|nr:ATP synthase F1 subunit delta [Phycisphaerae bacterium]